MYEVVKTIKGYEILKIIECRHGYGKSIYMKAVEE